MARAAVVTWTFHQWNGNCAPSFRGDDPHGVSPPPSMRVAETIPFGRSPATWDVELPERNRGYGIPGGGGGRCEMSWPFQRSCVYYWPGRIPSRRGTAWRRLSRDQAKPLPTGCRRSWNRCPPGRHSRWWWSALGGLRPPHRGGYSRTSTSPRWPGRRPGPGKVLRRGVRRGEGGGARPGPHPPSHRHSRPSGVPPGRDARVRLARSPVLVTGPCGAAFLCYTAGSHLLGPSTFHHLRKSAWKNSTPGRWYPVRFSKGSITAGGFPPAPSRRWYIRSDWMGRSLELLSFMRECLEVLCQRERALSRPDVLMVRALPCLAPVCRRGTMEA